MLSATELHSMVYLGNVVFSLAVSNDWGMASEDSYSKQRGKMSTHWSSPLQSKKNNDNLKQMSKYLHSYNMTQQAFPKNVIVFFKCGSLPDIQKETTSTQAAHTYQKFLVHLFDSTR